MSGWLVAAAGTALMTLAMLAGVGASAVRRVDLYRWVVRGRPGAVAAGALLATPARLLAAAHGLVAVGATTAGLGLAAVLAALAPPLAAAALVFVAVPVVLTVGYAVPRALGRRWPEAIVQRAVPLLNRIAVVTAPLPRARVAQGARPEPAPAGHEDPELPVLSGLLAFTERSAREVMTPRTEIVAVREGASFDEAAQRFAESGYSRLPVYRESLDNIVGMVYVFDLLKLAPGAEFPVRPVMTVPASKRCAELLFEMQRARCQFAVVLDEYGGTAGIVTFEDLLEELVGEIFDEYDSGAVGEQPGLDVVEATGATPVEELAARFEVELPTPAQSVGGLLARAAGRIPRAGERFALAGLEFDVVQATPTRVERVVVRRGPVPVTPLPR